MKLRHFFRLLPVVILALSTSCDPSDKQDVAVINEAKIAITPAGNSWSENPKSNIIISDDDKDGSATWSEDGAINSWFKSDTSGELIIALDGVGSYNGDEAPTVTVTVADKSIDKSIIKGETNTIAIGNFNIEEAGYNPIKISISGLNGGTYKLNNIMVGGAATSGQLQYSKDQYYWSRRGPSVHLNYETPSDAGDIEWFYSEINVPEGNDVIGSYFMANGFGEGYFGMQVNSSSERRVLFSVWSPFETDNPEDIPDDQKITLIKKGEDVQTGEFGDEGSGGQSFRRYMWSAGNSYRFLLRGKPYGEDKTEYTAYFYAPEIGKWELIASFRRPKLATYLTKPHSFLENFMPEQGNISRMALYSNQWLCNSEGEWHEITKTQFSADNTARRENRMDYTGGSYENTFFMKNCGFFSENTEIGSWHNRPATDKAPNIDFESLP